MIKQDDTTVVGEAKTVDDYETEWQNAKDGTEKKQIIEDFLNNGLDSDGKDNIPKELLDESPCMIQAYADFIQLYDDKNYVDDDDDSDDEEGKETLENSFSIEKTEEVKDWTIPNKGEWYLFQKCDTAEDDSNEIYIEFEEKEKDKYRYLIKVKKNEAETKKAPKKRKPASKKRKPASKKPASKKRKRKIK